MTQFVKCVKSRGETIWLNMSAVKLVRRAEKADQNDIVEDFEGNQYICLCPIGAFEGCVVSVNAWDEATQQPRLTETELEQRAALAELNERLENINRALLDVCHAIYCK